MAVAVTPNKKCQYCGRPLAGEICPAHGYVGNPIPVTPVDPATFGVPTGAEMQWPVATPPPGWLIEDGSSQLISDYPALSALIRGTYSGADAAHFYLPDMRGVVPVGYKNGDANFGTLGGTGGEVAHLLTAAESGLPAHAHGIDLTTNATAFGGGYFNPGNSSATGSPSTTLNNTARSAASAHDNLQPFGVRNFVIKT